MTDLEDRELSYHVVQQDDDRFQVVLRWQDLLGDRIVAYDMPEGAAVELCEKLTGADLNNVDIRRIQDCGARMHRDDPEYQIIY